MPKSEADPENHAGGSFARRRATTAATPAIKTKTVFTLPFQSQRNCAASVMPKRMMKAEARKTT
jgi:hypothetical protein